MSTYEKQIDKVRNCLKEHKAERYPFENTVLAEKDEYTKSLYLRMLCTLIRYTGEPAEAQVFYVRRIMAGIQAEQEFQDYMKMALDLDTADVGEFMAVFKEDSLKYYFGIDGIILLALTECVEKHYELLAELVELLGITRKELEYLSAAAKAIMCQSSELFDEAKGLLPDSMRALSLYHYISDFYTGICLDTPEECHVFSCDKEMGSWLGYSSFTAKRVIIENISATLSENIMFDGCSEVIIRNCCLVGNEYRMGFNQVGTVIVEDCEIRDFSNRFAYFESTNNVTMCRNRFLNCGFTQKCDFTKKYPRGGGVLVFGGMTKSILLEDNQILKCYIKGNDAIARSVSPFGFMRVENKACGLFACFFGKIDEIRVFRNYFSGCSENGEFYIDGCLNGSQIQEANNVSSGSIIDIINKSSDITEKLIKEVFEERGIDCENFFDRR